MYHLPKVRHLLQQFFLCLSSASSLSTKSQRFPLQDPNETDAQTDGDERKRDPQALHRWQQGRSTRRTKSAETFPKWVVNLYTYPAETIEVAADAPPVAALPTL